MAFRPIFYGLFALALAAGFMQTNAASAPVNNKPVMTLGKGTMYRAEFSPDDRWCATSSQDCQLTLWDNWDGSRAQDFIGHTAAVVDVRFSPDGASLYSVADDNTMRRWDVASGRQLACQAWPADPPRSVDINSSGTRLAVIRASGLVQFCDPLTMDPVSTLTVTMKNPVARLRFSPKSNYVLLESEYSTASTMPAYVIKLDGTVVFERNSTYMIFMDSAEEGVVYSDFTWNDQCWKYQKLDGTLVIKNKYDNISQYVTGFLPETNEAILQPAFVENSFYTYAMKACNVMTSATRIISGPKAEIVTIKTSRDGNLIECASSDGRIFAWSTTDGQLKRCFRVHDPIYGGGVEFSKDGRHLLACSWDSTVNEYEFPGGRLLRSFMVNEWRSYLFRQTAHFMHDENKIIACERDGNVVVYDADQGEVMHHKKMSSDLCLRDVACPPSTDTLIISYSGLNSSGILTYDWHTSTTSKAGLVNYYGGISFINENRFLAMRDGIYEVEWPSFLLKRSTRLDGNCLDFCAAPNGKLAIAALSNGILDVVDLDSFSISKKIDVSGGLSTTPAPKWVRILPDNQRFVVGYIYNIDAPGVHTEAELRSVNTGALIESFDAPGLDSIYGDVSPDGKYLAVSQDGRVYVYELPGPDAAASWALYE